MPPALSIILPCYNPPAGWSDNIIAKYADLQQRFGSSIEVVLVIDGESNNVAQSDIQQLNAAIQYFKPVSYTPNKGKGYAIRKGVEAASGNITIYTDVDFPYTNDSIGKIYRTLLADGADVAIGIKDEHYYRQVAPSRKAISRMLHVLVRRFLSIPVTDTQCGLKGFNNSAKQLFLQTTINRYLFDLEFIRNSYKAGLRLKPVPVQLNKGVFIGRLNYFVLLPEMANFIRLMFR